MFTASSAHRLAELIHAREKSVYQHAGFMRYMTHVMTAWLFCWEFPFEIVKYCPWKSVHQHAWFMRYMTHVMTTWLFVEESPLRDCKIPMPAKEVFISMRGLCVT
jgi:hypothetical protein